MIKSRQIIHSEMFIKSEMAEKKIERINEVVLPLLQE